MAQVRKLINEVNVYKDLDIDDDFSVQIRMSMILLYVHCCKLYPTLYGSAIKIGVYYI
jgi:hypothetical protein